MKKKILIASFFAAIMLMVPLTAVAGSSDRSTEQVLIIRGTDSIQGYDGNSNGEDNPLGWWATLGGYISAVRASFQPIKVFFWTCLEVLDHITDIFAEFGDWNNFEEFLQWVGKIIILPFEIIMLIPQFIAATEEFGVFMDALGDLNAYLSTEPWNAPVTIRGTVSGPGGPLVGVDVYCNEESTQTDTEGHYILDEINAVKPLGPFSNVFPPAYEVTASAGGYEQSKSKRMYPEGIVTIDFSLESTGDSGSSSSSGIPTSISGFSGAVGINPAIR